MFCASSCHAVLQKAAKIAFQMKTKKINVKVVKNDGFISGGSKYTQAISPSKKERTKRNTLGQAEKSKQINIKEKQSMITFGHKPESAVQRSHVLINQTF